MRRMNLGDFELTAVSDGLYRLDGGAFFGIIPKSMWSKKVQADQNNLVSAGLNSIVVRTGKQTILIETGIGNKLSEKMQKIRSEEHTSELQSRLHLVCRLLLEKKKEKI